jgi:5-methylcytosine-specific restriction enzyme subunit McrC
MNSRYIELEEYTPIWLDKSLVDKKTGELIYDRYRNQIEIEFPTHITRGRWKLVSLGWVGLIRVSDDFYISMKPKVKIHNLLAMWEYAYRLKSFNILEGMVECETLIEFYNQLAAILSHRILDRSRKGLYKSYENRVERLSYITGRLMIDDLISRPLDTKVECEYQENTVNNEDNQILLWALYTILRNDSLDMRIRSLVRKAYMTLQGSISLMPVYYTSCINRSYNSLNFDYRLLHAVCRFFLESVGPSYQQGQTSMMPFMVNMGRLFEMFVSEWLKLNLPPTLELKVQENVSIGEENEVSFKIDLVIYDSASQDVLCVLDTKYKKPNSISNADINQIITYSELKGCNIGILIYPEPIKIPNKLQINQKIVVSMSFDISGDIEAAGKRFVKELLEVLGCGSSINALGS